MSNESGPILISKNSREQPLAEDEIAGILPEDKPHPPPPRQPYAFWRRSAAALLCAVFAVSLPANLSDITKTAAGLPGTAGLIIGSETAAAPAPKFVNSNFFEAVIAVRLKKHLPRSQTPPPGGDPEPGGPGEDLLLDVPLNPRPGKSAVSRITYDGGSGNVKTTTIRVSKPSGYTYYEDIFIKNGTTYAPDIKKLLEESLSFAFNPSEPQILIIHTHTTESFTPGPLDSFEVGVNERTTDINYSVARVGAEVKRELAALGISALHDTGLYDYPQYSGAYQRSKAAVEEYLRNFPSIKIVLDIHRDALAASDGSKYRLISDIDGEETAQIMLLVGTDKMQNDHPDWRENLKLALKVQREHLDIHPDLARPLRMTNSSYLQFVAPGAMIVEIGTNGNSLDEAVRAGQQLARAVAAALKNRG